MSHNISISVNDKLWPHIKDKPNKSRFIGELIKEHIHGSIEKPIVLTVKNALLVDEIFIAELAERMKKGTSSPSSSTTTLPKEPFIPRPPNPTTGYPCCSSPVPCKHWQWDDIQQHHINNLTGAVRSAGG